MSGRKQRGFSIITAIFILVVLAALGGFMVTISGSQHMTAASAALGARAYYAARSGAEWGAGQALAAVPSCAATTTVALPDYAEFTVVVTCAATVHTEITGSPYSVYQLTSTATSNGVALGQHGYVARRVVLVVTNA